MKNIIYQAPSVEIVPLNVEQVFAASDVKCNAISIDSVDSVDYGEF